LLEFGLQKSKIKNGLRFKLPIDDGLKWYGAVCPHILLFKHIIVR
jgi:hypothetical protein